MCLFQNLVLKELHLVSFEKKCAFVGRIFFRSVQQFKSFWASNIDLGFKV